MRDARPSLTAVAVAVARGIGRTRESADPTAAVLLPSPIAAALAAVPNHPALGGLVRGALRMATLGMIDHVSLRTAAIDEFVAQAVAAGCTQLVLLGAGFDGRAYRLDDLAHVDAFTVDHAATAGLSRTGRSRSQWRTRSLTEVAVDFETERLSQRLRAAGYAPERPTCWTWEGVTPYLRPEAIVRTLTDVGECSAPGSRIAMTYATPQLVTTPLPGLERVVSRAFAALGEPLLGAMAPAEAAQRLASEGFAVECDSDSRDWAKRFGGSARLASPFRAERLVTARRDP